MKDYIEERAINIAMYIIDNNTTVRQTAKAFGVSKSTVHKDVTSRLMQVNPTLAKQARAVLDVNKSERHIRGGLATREKINKITELAFKVNEFMIDYFRKLNIDLVDFKLEFGKFHGEIILADEISPDTCRFWDSTTKEKLDKDRFRRDMGGVEDAYKEIFKRVTQGE